MANTQWLIFAVLILVWVVLLVRGYNEAKSSWKTASDSSKAFYVFINNLSWETFKCWYAATANEPWMDILATLAIGFLPIPGLPSTLGGRLNIVLAKIGMYKLSTTLILGSPRYPTPCIEMPSRLTHDGYAFTE